MPTANGLDGFQTADGGNGKSLTCRNDADCCMRKMRRRAHLWQAIYVIAFLCTLYIVALDLAQQNISLTGSQP